MSNFVPTKEHLREVVLHYFILKKKAAQAHRILVEVYGEYAPSERTCQKWFGRFKDGDFDVEDRERPGRPKKFEDKELEALLNEDPNQTTQQLADALNVNQATISKRRKKQLSNDSFIS